MIKPNLFVVGAPKCGTTSLYHYLCGHPHIYMSPVKEPCFWASDFPHRQQCSDLRSYLQLFKDADGSYQYWGEASPLYMRSETAIPALYDFNPDARLIVMLRNPVEVLPSFHSERYHSFSENEVDFEKAWLNEEKGILGTGMHGNIPSRYRDVVDFSRQLDRIWQYYPREQVHIILFEDLVRDTPDTFGRLLKFLDLDNDHAVDFRRYNENKGWKNENIGRLLSRPPQFVRKLASLYKSVTGTTQIPLRRTLMEANQTKSERAPLSPAFRRELTEYFSDEIDRLSVLIGRDLSHWKTTNRDKSAS